VRHTIGTNRLALTATITSLALSVVSCSKTTNLVAPPVIAQATPPAVAAIPIPTLDKDLVSDQRAIAAAQRALAQLGYDPGKADGVAGPETRRMVMAFQRDHGLTEDGRLTFALVEALRADLVQPSKVASLTVGPGDTLFYNDGSLETVVTERVLGWDAPVGSRNIVAIRPSTTSWPAAARAGLDWATSHALDVASSSLVQWSSTGVGQHFEIRTYPALSGREVSLVGSVAQTCRKFEMRTDDPDRRYPGIACKDSHGTWYIPHTRIRLARPAAGLGPQTASAVPIGTRK
jgi:peptidoglycan hydrolase-like protein with peptidoglycan-binding domain